MADTQVTVTLAEYGNTIETTAALRGQSFLNVDEDAANVIGYNAADSIDQIVADVAYAGSTLNTLVKPLAGLWPLRTP